MLATPSQAMCELCADRQPSNPGFHFTPSPVGQYTGPHTSLPSLTQPVGGGGGGGGNGGNSTTYKIVPIKINPGPGDAGNGPEGVLKDQKGKGLLQPGGGAGRGGDDQNQVNLLIACGAVDGQVDLRFKNIGSALIPAGSQVRWSVQPTGQHGALVLNRDIKVGASINAPGLLRAAAADGASCSSRLM